MLDNLKTALSHKLCFVPHLAKWANELAQVAASMRTPDTALDFALDLAAIMDRESLGGDALKPPGPAGTGDWTPRHGKMPPDGKGWGRGLMQLDYAAHPELMDKTMPDGTPAWENPLENIKAGALIYHHNLLHFNGDKIKAFAAYNTGIGNVQSSIEKGLDPDTTTAHGNYGKDVLRRRNQF